MKVLQGKEHLYQEDPPKEINSCWLNQQRLLCNLQVPSNNPTHQSPGFSSILFKIFISSHVRSPYQCKVSLFKILGPPW